MANIKIDFNLGDPEPEKVSERKEYAAKVAAFFQDIGNKKINFLISELGNELIDPDKTDEEHQKIRLTINGMSLILDWAESMTVEHIGDSLPENIKEADVFGDNN